MSGPLYVEQDVVPFAETGKEIMLVFRDHGLNSARPSVFITALTPNAAVTVVSGKGANTNAYTSSTSVAFTARGQKEVVEVPIGGDMTDIVSVVTVDSGNVAVSVVSATPVQTEFRTRRHP
jgi:hypothetical protein